MFVEELDKARQQLEEQRRLTGELERDKTRLVGELRLAKDRAGKLETECESLRVDLRTAGQKLAEAGKQVELTVLLEQAANAANDAAKAATARAEKADRQLEQAKTDLKAVREELAGCRARLEQQEKDAVRAAELLAAFEQVAEANKVIAARG